MKTNDYAPNEIRSGFFVLFSVCVLLGLLFMSGKFTLFKENYNVPILFNYISGLETNAPVHVAGYQVGKVTDIRFTGAEGGSVRITVSISKDVILKKDAEAYLNVAGFMGEMFVELFAGSPDAPALRPDEPIRGEDPIPLMELVKKGSQLTDEFEKIVASLKTLIGDLEEMIGTNKPEIGTIFQNLEVTSQNLKEMTHDLKRHPWKLLRKGEETSEEEASDEKRRRFLFF